MGTYSDLSGTTVLGVVEVLQRGTGCFRWVAYRMHPVHYLKRHTLSHLANRDTSPELAELTVLTAVTHPATHALPLLALSIYA